MVPGIIFVSSLVLGTYVLAQLRELRRKPKAVASTMPIGKKSLDEVIKEVKAKYPPIEEYDMKEV